MWWVGRVAAFMIVLTCGCSSETDAGSPEAQPPAPAAPPPAASPPGAGTEGEADAIPDGPPPLFDPNEPPASRLAKETARIITAAKATSYSHRTVIDEANGTFDVDCSGFVDYALARVVPDAYATLTAAKGTNARPLAETFVAVVSAPVGRWHRIDKASDLTTGDLVAWLTPPGVTNGNTGHVMVVRAPVTVKGSNIVVPVMDSTSGPHGSSDSRFTAKTTGVGTGEIVLTLDKDGVLIGYHWSTESNSPLQKTTIALGRLQ
jgi:hypothetical protein